MRLFVSLGLGPASTPGTASESRNVFHAMLFSRLPLLFASALAFAGCSSAQVQTERASFPVIASVIDGDTVVIEFAPGVEETVRLLGIDTPETVDPNRPVQCFGAEASAHVHVLLPPATPVRLERDVEARDHFGRLLAYIYRARDDLFVNLDLVQRGLADVTFYEPNTTHRGDFDTALVTAKTQAVGLWSACGGADVPLDPER